ncbi:DUF202 domain-containing protein [Streptomyces sp. NBC_01387]|uniref:YidH family protein n=1 Tax=unclassified Streptomyces TaxID=2593676 RepID=UPI0022527CE8|nr:MULTISPECIES: DUF202 domain-containing protein [unclassified Streptomyces]MCX4548037.1 DUF202 domain-containing protein [Streptomyces sp. NBC_01500]WSC19705.1 DUF202 domain-containing protein [Streptomyces sp. NBC_01766]WSV53727.1 DUF202 domain-containing protein [Streptomyces sp. NBC_01014]
MPEDEADTSRSGAWWQRGEEPDYRATLANERTLLAWSRTSLALLAASFAVVRLTGITPRALRLALAGYLIALSSGVMVAGYVQWRTRQDRMRQRQPLGGIVSPPLLSLAMILLVGFVVAVIVFAS